MIATKNIIRCRLNAGIEKVYPELEDVTLKATKESQTFKSETHYGYNEVTLKPINLEDKTVTPTKEQIIVESDTADGLNSVIVEPIPDEYIKPTGTKEIVANGDYDISQFANVQVAVGGIKKGLIIHACDENGFVTDASIVGMNALPERYLRADGTLGNVISKNLKNLNLPTDLVSIGDYACYYCTNLELEKIPETVTSIGRSAFEYCYNLKVKELPKAIKRVPSYGFRSCYLYDGFTLHDEITGVGTYAFASTKLKEIVIPESCTGIDGQAFEQTPLTKVVIKSTTSLSISVQAFRTCNSLTHFIIDTEAPVTISSSTFQNSAIEKGTAFIYVPDNMIDEYKSKTNFSVYASQIKGLSELEA